MKKTCGIVGALLLGIATTGQAQKVVRGTVRDAASGLPGVTVLVRGTQTGVATNLQGDFQLVLPRDTVTLLFSFIGYEPLQKRLIATRDTTRLAPTVLREECIIDFFYHKHVELSWVSGLRYTPVGGKIKVFYPSLLHARHSQGSLRAECSYQVGGANYQRYGTLALDNLFLTCDHNVDVTAEYQRVELSELNFAYTRYTLGAAYAGKWVSKRVPVYLAAGRLTYSADGVAAGNAGLEAGVGYPLFVFLNRARTSSIQLVLTGRVAWWQEYWQFRSSAETEFNWISLGVSFNKLGPYTEVTTRLGVKIQRRFREKKVAD